MFSLLRHPCSYEYHPKITTLLTGLGATQNEIVKNLPKIDEERRKRKLGEERKKVLAEENTKRPRLNEPFGDYEMKPDKKSSEDTKHDTVEQLARDLLPLLIPQNVTDLVLISMVSLPDTIPSHFQSSFTPISAAGTPQQIEHVGRLLASQFIGTGVGRYGQSVKEESSDESPKRNQEDQISAKEIPSAGKPLFNLY